MQKYRNRILAGFGIVFMIYVVYLLIVPVDDLLGNLQAFPLWLLVPLVLLQLFAFVFRWIEWHYYLGVVGARKKITVMDSMIIQAAGFTLAVSPGKAAEVLKSVVLKTKTGTEISRSAPVVLAERVVDAIAVILLMAIAVALGGDTTGISGAQRAAVYTAALLIVAGMIAVQIAPLAYVCLRILGYIPLLKRAKDALTDFYESSREVFHLRHVVPMSIVGIGVYGCATLTLATVLYGFGVPFTYTTLLQSALVAGIAAAVGAVTGTPNGAGTTEGTAQVALMAMLGMATGPAAAAAVINSFFNRWFRVFAGLIVAVVFRKRLFDPSLESELEKLEQKQQPVAV